MIIKFFKQKNRQLLCSASFRLENLQKCSGPERASLNWIETYVKYYFTEELLCANNGVFSQISLTNFMNEWYLQYNPVDAHPLLYLIEYIVQLKSLDPFLSLIISFEIASEQ